MSLLSSLTNRIFLVSAALVVVSMGVAIYRVNESVTAQAEIDLRTGLGEAAALVDDLSRTQFAESVVKSRLIADLPKLKGAAATDDPPTVLPIAVEYRRQVGADLFVVLGRSGRLLARTGRVEPGEADIAAIVNACTQSPEGTTFWPYGAGILHAVAIPLEPGETPLGTLVVGFSLDQAAAERFKAITKSEIVLVAGGRTIAATMEGLAAPATGGAAPASEIFTQWVGAEQYIGRVQPLGPPGHDTPVALVLRSQTERLKFLQPLHWQIVLAGLGAVAIATMLGYAIARTVTRPVRALTTTMREIAATGDLGRPVPAAGRWDDEDARTLSRTFHQLTGSLHRFQREAAQRERLSSLGRLSTVVAHEVRNPLMIIKSAVRKLRRHPSSDVTDAVTSIDEEVTRLNRVVTDVLDFARPIRFELAPADLVEVCRDAAQASQATPDAVAVTVQTSQSSIPVVTDRERLRSVLVNVLDNAQEAVRADAADRPARPAIQMAVAAAGAPDRWRIEIRDCGIGIAPEAQARMFEPFFTTRRGGSGLGLAIARNVIEGLGGSIVVESQPPRGTTVRIELPERPAEAQT